MSSDQPKVALRETFKVEKFKADEHIMLQTPTGMIHSPFCVTSVCPGAIVDETVIWSIDGKQVTDPVRIEEMERKYREQCRT